MPLSRDEITEIGHRVRRAGAANCWTGTSGAIAADARRLVRHIEETQGVCEYPSDHILRGEAELQASRHDLVDEAAILTEDDVADLVHETRKATDIGGDVVPAVDEVTSRKSAVRMVPSQAEPWKHVPADLLAWVEKGKAASKADEARRPAVRFANTGAVRPGTDAFLGVLEEIATLHVRKSLDYGHDGDALANIRAGGEAIGVDPWKGCVLRISDKMQRLKAFCRRGECEFDGVEDTLADIAAYAAIALVMYREASAPPPG